MQYVSLLQALMTLSVYTFIMWRLMKLIIERIASVNGNTENASIDYYVNRIKVTQRYLESLESKEVITKQDVQEAWSQLQDTNENNW